jgi:hypothetical protein
MNKIISVDEWLQALLDAQKTSDPEGMSWRDLCKKANMGGGRLRQLVREANERGVIKVQCQRKRIVAMDGRNTWIPVYRFEKVKK